MGWTTKYRVKNAKSRSALVNFKAEMTRKKTQFNLQYWWFKKHQMHWRSEDKELTNNKWELTALDKWVLPGNYYWPTAMRSRRDPEMVCRCSHLCQTNTYKLHQMTVSRWLPTDWHSIWPIYLHSSLNLLAFYLTNNDMFSDLFIW